MSKIFRCSTVFSLIVSVLAIAVATPPAPVNARVAKTAVSTSIYKIVSAEAEGAPPGCVYGCPTVKTSYPAISAQSSANSASLANATKIDTSENYGSATNLCAMIAGGLQCFGTNSNMQLGDGTTIDRSQLVVATSNGTPLSNVTDVSVGGNGTCVVANGDLRCTGANFHLTEQWKVYASGVKTVQISNYTGFVCALFLDGQAKCATITSSTEAPTWVSFSSSNLTGVVMTNDTVCVSGPKSQCATFRSQSLNANGTTSSFTNYRDVVGGDNSEAIYSMSSGICAYATGAISCGALSLGSSTTASIKLQTLGVMPKPLSVFSSQGSGFQKIVFLTNTGLLFADSSWIFCGGCNTSTNSAYLANIAAFTDSTATNYSYITKVNAITDSAEYLNLTVESGTRKMRSLTPFVIKTQSGTPLVGTSVKWAAPDAPGLLASSKTSSIISAEGGAARTTLSTGPVTFTLQYGLASTGAELQATSLTVVVPETGPFDIVVPDPPAIVDRKITVTLPDNAPVPNATVTLKNNYITYAYQSSSAGTSVWTASPKDNSGYMSNVGCAYCYVAPPTYITGDDGSVTFRSFAPSVRSSQFDAAVGYDDGELSQTVQYNFSGISSTVQMAFMAQLNLTVSDQNKSTTDIDVNANSKGVVEIPIELEDESGIAIADFPASTETVCDVMDTGGLYSATQNVGSVCSSNVKSKSVEMAVVSQSGVQAMGVTKSAACSTKKSARTGSSGKAKLRLCATKSTKLRIRGMGALGSRTFCLRVKGKPCASAVPTTNMGSRLMSVNSTPTARSLIAPVGRGAVTYSFERFRGECSKTKSNKIVVASWLKKNMSNNPGGYSCTLIMTQKKSGKNPAVKKTLTLLLR